MKRLSKVAIVGLLTISTLFAYESGEYRCVFTTLIKKDGIIKKLPEDEWEVLEFDLKAYKKITTNDASLEYEGTKDGLDFYIGKFKGKTISIIIKDKKLKGGFYSAGFTGAGINITGYCKKVK